MKTILKQVVGTFVGMIVNALLTMLATKIIDTLYNTYIKKPMCFLCGSTGVRIVENELSGAKTHVRCSCRPEKRKWWKWKTKTK